jgi:hypothetical protein
MTQFRAESKPSTFPLEGAGVLNDLHKDVFVTMDRLLAVVAQALRRIGHPVRSKKLLDLQFVSVHYIREYQPSQGLRIMVEIERGLTWCSGVAMLIGCFFSPKK